MLSVSKRLVTWPAPDQWQLFSWWQTNAWEGATLHRQNYTTVLSNYTSSNDVITDLDLVTLAKGRENLCPATFTNWCSTRCLLFAPVTRFLGISFSRIAASLKLHRDVAYTSDSVIQRIAGRNFFHKTSGLWNALRRKYQQLSTASRIVLILITC